MLHGSEIRTLEATGKQNIVSKAALDHTVLRKRMVVLGRNENTVEEK